MESFLNLGEILVSNGSRAVPKGAWRCSKSFGSNLASVFFDFPPLRWHFFMKNQDAILVKIEISVSSQSHFFNFWEKIWYQMDPERCQKEPGGLSKLWHQCGISFLRLSSIKIALFREKSRCDFSQNRDFSFFPRVISSTFGRKSGTKWIQSGAKMSLEVF